MALDPLKLVAAMVCENGTRWGDQASPQQWTDMRALLSQERPNYHFWLRPRGGSKTFDSGAATIAVMLTRAGQGDEMYAAANGKDQAGLLAVKIASIVRNTPQLASAVEVQQNRVIAPSTGAVLEVLSSDAPGSWGKTPLWLFMDEMCNWENAQGKKEFATSLLTSLVKRPGCTCLIASTPSWEGHWSWDRWQRANKSAESRGLWRPSWMPGPAGWQDPEELAEQREDLLDYEWRRLFLCEWAAADDIMADEAALADCTREGLSLEPAPGTEYVITWDIGWKKDHSAVAVLHLGERGGRKAVIVDRLDSWVPKDGREVRISDVMAHAAAMSALYNGALMTGDPHEAWQTVQDLRSDGYNIRPAETTANANSVRAKMMLRLVRDRAIEIPPDDQLRREFLSLRLAESTTPGVVRLSSDGSARGHHDRVMAILYGVGELLNRPGQNWRDYCGPTRECQACGTIMLVRSPACHMCRTANPEAPAPKTRAETTEFTPQPGGWLAALLGPGARKCGNCGHVYSGETYGDRCPRCAGGTAQTASSQLPAAFSRALSLTARR